MRFGSVCSGIEAASVAWAPLGWRAAWLAEIEPFPSAVLAHHYPDVPNLGDMTALPERIASGEVEAPDVFCGGTPCQAFSVAGLRQSLDDARGNLSLTFCEIADAIDISRARAGCAPSIIVWENVPGVLNTKDNAFGCFLAGLAGEDGALVAPGGKWPNSGAVYGPQRAVAWRVFDAQYFGLAQRRRRVFVVASARDGFDSAAILFEFDGMRRDIAPRRETGQAVAHTTAPCLTGSGRGVARTGDPRGQDPVVAVMAHGQGGAEIAGNRSPTLTCNHEAPIVFSPVTRTLRGEGFDASEDGTGRGTPLVPVPISFNATMSVPQVDFDLNQTLQAKNPAAIAFSCKDYGPDAGELSPTLRAMSHSGSHANAGGQVAVLAFDTTQVTSRANVSNPKPGGPCHPLAAGAHAPAIAVALRGREGGATAELGDEVGHCLRASSGGADKPHVLASVAPTLKRDYGKGYGDGEMDPGGTVMHAMQVRRLTPRECERLQGFPDDYTAIPWRKKTADLCSDGPRYKALGNSWAVPNVRWIGRRIALALSILASRGDA